MSVCHLRAAKEEEKGEVRVGRAIFSRGVRRTSLAEVGHGGEEGGQRRPVGGRGTACAAVSGSSSVSASGGSSGVTHDPYNRTSG